MQTISFAERIAALTWGEAAFVVRLAKSATRWRYFPHVLGALIFIVAAIVVYRSYRSWDRAWLSDRVEQELQEMRRNRRKNVKPEAGRRVPRAFAATCRNYSFRLISTIRDYFLKTFWRHLRTIYLPSVASVALVLLVISLVLFVPHPPAHYLAALEPKEWWHAYLTDLKDTEGVPRVFEGLIVVTVALIIFVAESVRGSRNIDEKRVFLKISYLWPLALLITFSPMVFLYPPPTGATTVLLVIITLVAIFGFARVLLNLLDAGGSVQTQRQFLKERVRSTVLYSARERIGNRILHNSLGAGKQIPIAFTLSRAWLPSGERQYVFVDAPSEGTLDDINLSELRSLGELIGRWLQQAQPVLRATAQTGNTAGPGSGPSRAGRAEIESNQAYLLRRFKEEMPRESAFSRDRSIIAIPRAVGRNRALMDEIAVRVRHTFRFSQTESPSAAFRREMQGTKDLLLAAIRSASLGAIDDLRNTYLTVAEEFLNILVELGGGYTASQAKEERSNFFQGWSEIKWLIGDMRELLIAAAETNNTDVIATITFLPYAIATRAYLAGDNLLFQEFLSFASFIYFMGSQKHQDSPIREFLIERSWRYLRDLAVYYIQPSLMAEADDE